MKRALFATTVAIGVATAGGVAHAHIIFSAGNNPGPNEENILFGAKYTGVTSLTGFTNQSNIGVDFFVLPGGNTTIGTQGIGQSDIICTGGCGTYGQGGANGAQLTALGIQVQAGYGARDFIGNLDFGEGTAQIRVTDEAGAIFDFLLGNGQNFFTLNAINNQVITSILITEFGDDGNGNFGWNDFKQPRISGLCLIGETGCQDVVINPQCTDGTCPVPEPPTLAIFGFGLFAAGWFAMRRKARCLA